MDAKHALGLLALLAATLVGIMSTTISRRLREAAFFLLVLTPVIVERLGITFVSQEWYRGTTRGFEFTLLDVLAISVLVSSLLRPQPGMPRWYWPASLGFLLLYFMYAGFSVAISEPQLFGWFELSKIFRGIIVFLAAAMFVRTERELRILIFALGCAVCYEAALGIREKLLYHMERVTGSLGHANSLSMYLCLTAPVFAAAFHAALPRWLRLFSAVCMGMATVAIVLTVSRAGLPIFALVMLGTTAICMSWRLSWQKVALVSLVSLGLGGMLYVSWEELAWRYASASLKEEYLEQNAESRGFYLRLARAIVSDHFLGVGLNNWSYWVSKQYAATENVTYDDYDDLPEKPSPELLDAFEFAAPAHNLGAITIGELGVPGLLIFALVWLRWFHVGQSLLWRRLADPMRRLGVGFFFGTCGIFLQSQTEWVYRQTAIQFTFHLLLGALASLYYLKRHARRSIPEEVVAFDETAAPDELVMAGAEED